VHVLIVARSAPAAEAIRRALRFCPNLRVLGWVDPSLPPATDVDGMVDIVVMDGGSAPGTVLARVRELRAAHPTAKLVLLADHVAAPLLREAAAASVDAVISKAALPTTVGVLIREVAAGNVFHFVPASARSVTPTTRNADALTNRELQMLRLVAAGLSNGRIAAQLWVTEQTVKFHLSNVYRKLGLSNRTQAAHYAFLHGLVDTSGAAGSEPSISVAA
jgi:DNA-binding NarL/FixJ family response regulator